MSKHLMFANQFAHFPMHMAFPDDHYCELHAWAIITYSKVEKQILAKFFIGQFAIQFTSLKGPLA